LREIVLRALEHEADASGVVRETPLYLADQIISAIALSDGGEDV